MKNATSQAPAERKRCKQRQTSHLYSYREARSLSTGELIVPLKRRSFR
nr:MAG TPA: hypothetical protein [Caudoviricetes sp.]